MSTHQLTIHSIHEVVDNCLSNLFSKEDEEEKEVLIRCRRGLDKDINSINDFCLEHEYLSSSLSSRECNTHPSYFYILLEAKEVGDDSFSMKGFAVWYIGYSTWKGRVMNLDTIHTTKSVSENILMNALVKIARAFAFSRIVYQVQGKGCAKLFQKKYNAELLSEWLTLQMGKREISSFLATRDSVKVVSQINTNIVSNGNNEIQIHDRINITLKHVESTIDTILCEMNRTMERRKKESKQNIGITLKLRRGKKQDAKSILNLVNGLALYEKALEEVHVNETIYQIDGSGDHPLYHCILLEKEKVKGDHDDSSPAVVGMGFFYFGYSMVKKSSGKFLYLEDLFIEEPYRGNGYGKAIMYALANICMQLDCERFVWQALNWNFPALKFYDNIGAKICDGLTTLRFDKDKIASFSS